jgi:hypothetical protein
MSNRTLFLTDTLYEYMRSLSLREPEILKRLREETSHDPMSIMQITPEQGQFMSLLVKLRGLPGYWKWVSTPAIVPFAWHWHSLPTEKWWPAM